MKEVFLVIDEWAVGGDESCDENITCYNSYEDAKKDYDERVRSAKIDAEEWDCDELEEGSTDDKDYFFTYRDGWYAEYHISVSLIRKEVY